MRGRALAIAGILASLALLAVKTATADPGVCLSAECPEPPGGGAPYWACVGEYDGMPPAWPYDGTRWACVVLVGHCEDPVCTVLAIVNPYLLLVGANVGVCTLDMCANNPASTACVRVAIVRDCV